MFQALASYFMLKLFFNRDSLIVKACFWGAALLTFLFLRRGGWEALHLSEKILFGFLIFQIFFAKAVEIYPWYPKEALGPGIRLQFQKAIVPVSYLWLAFILLEWIKPLKVWLVSFNLLLLPMGIVACILIYFHRMDPDSSRPNVLSGAKETTVPSETALTPELKESLSP
jgi:hypothetical protein